MKQPLLKLLCLFFFMIASRAGAELSCTVSPSKEKFYRLDLSIPATFCIESSDDPSCKNFPKKSLIQLHGLWPNYKKGFPSGICSAGECKEQDAKLGKFCSYPEPGKLYSSGVWKANSEYMAGVEKCLERHEWVKHGTCSTMSNDPVEYFGWSLKMTKHIADALNITPDKAITRAEFNEMIKTGLPELDGSIRVQCKGQNVSGIAIFFSWDKILPGKPIQTSSGQNSYGNCGNKFIFPSRASK